MPAFIPFGAPVPIPGHWMPDDTSWSYEHDIGKAIGQALTGPPQSPQAVHYEGFDQAVSWGASASLWHTTSHRTTTAPQSAYFGREDVWNYDTGKTESGYIVSPPITLPNRGISLQFDFWTDHEICTNTVADVFTVYWYDGEYHKLRRWSSEDGEAQPQEVWKTINLDMSEFRQGTGQLLMHVTTVDARDNAHEGWYVDSVEVIAR